LAAGQRASAQPCTGDCGGDFAVAVDEIVFGINVAIGRADAEDCPGFRPAGSVTIDVLVTAVANALDGCREAPELGELISGTAAYVNGTFVWTDYAYDDRGPNRDAAAGGDRTDSARAGGDVKYPPELAGGNAADLIQLQLGLDGLDLTVRAILQTLTDPTVPLLGIAFDIDRNPATGAETLPGGQWLANRALGVELLLVLSSAGGELQRFTNGAWASEASFAVVVDPERNVIEATVPFSVLDTRFARWRAFAALGIRTARGAWIDGGAPIFDLAFVGGELLIRWQENDQADILAGALDSERAAALVDFVRIADRFSEAPPLAGGRFHTFMYHSVLDLPKASTSFPMAPIAISGLTNRMPSSFPRRFRTRRRWRSFSTACSRTTSARCSSATPTSVRDARSVRTRSRSIRCSPRTASTSRPPPCRSSRWPAARVLATRASLTRTCSTCWPTHSGASPSIRIASACKAHPWAASAPTASARSNPTAGRRSRR
jgi:hypothetical protein